MLDKMLEALCAGGGRRERLVSSEVSPMLLLFAEDEMDLRAALARHAADGDCTTDTNRPEPSTNTIWRRS
jgi:hypothetical protein